MKRLLSSLLLSFLSFSFHLYAQPCNTLQETACIVSVYDILGKELQTKTILLTKGDNQILLPVNELKNGYYFISAQHATGTVSKN